MNEIVNTRIGSKIEREVKYKQKHSQMYIKSCTDMIWILYKFMIYSDMLEWNELNKMHIQCFTTNSLAFNVTICQNRITDSTTNTRHCILNLHSLVCELSSTLPQICCNVTTY